MVSEWDSEWGLPFEKLPEGVGVFSSLFSPLKDRSPSQYITVIEVI